MTEETPGEGHNSGGRTQAEQIRSLANRISHTEREKQALSEDIKEMYVEAKALELDVKALRDAVKVEMLNPTRRRERAEHMEKVDEYLFAIGELD